MQKLGAGDHAEGLDVRRYVDDDGEQAVVQRLQPVVGIGDELVKDL